MQNSSRPSGNARWRRGRPKSATGNSTPRSRRLTSHSQGARNEGRETDLAPSERLFVQVGLRVRIRLPPAESLKTLGPSRKLMRIEVERDPSRILTKGVGPRVRI